MPPVKRQPGTRRPTFFREWREHRGLKQYEAAERLGIEPSTLSRLEKGHSPYDQDIVEKMSLVYGCDVADLLTVNPLQHDSLRALISDLYTASPDLKRQAANVIAALMKAS